MDEAVDMVERASNAFRAIGEFRPSNRMARVMRKKMIPVKMPQRN
jgi:hypothetical protein